MADALDRPSCVKGMTRRENIEKNLLLNGGKYCYDQSKAALHHSPTANAITSVGAWWSAWRWEFRSM